MMISRDEQVQSQLNLAVEPEGETSGVGRVHGSNDVTSPHTRPRERFWNLPNTITTLRIGVVPVLLLLPWAQDKARSQVMAWLFIIAATTDIVDGWLARRGRQVTHIGKLLDPLADKLIVSTALVMLIATDRIPIWGAWMVVIILGRELAVTGLRGIASADGQVMSASWLGKAKAFAQNFAIGALLFHYTTLGLPAQKLGLVSLAIATVLAFWSGYLYFAEYFRGRARAERGEAGS